MDAGTGLPSPESEETAANPITGREPRIRQQNEIRAKPKRKTLFSFYKKVTTEGEGVDGSVDQICELDATPAAAPPAVVLQDEASPSPAGPEPKIRRLNSEDSVLIVERDPGLRGSIWDYPVDEQDRARRIYAMLGPYQIVKEKYPYSGPKSHPRCFQAHWLKEFSWLEYSPAKDAVFCFPCYLFSKKPSGRAGSNVFTVKGFKSWKKVKSGKECAFLSHMGSDSNSAHSYNVTCYNNLKNQLGHIDNMVEQRTSLEVKRNRLRLRVSIDTIRWLAFQACAFRGHDESENSRNQGNFLEMVKLLAEYDDEVRAVVLGSAPGNAKYTSPTIQKEILDIMAAKVQKLIRDEIGDAKFCLIVDESRDESRREQMALVVRFQHLRKNYAMWLATELLILCSSLDPSDSFSSLNIDNVCSLASKFYPADFTEQERANLRCQLRHYELDVPSNPRFQNLTSVADLCRRLVETKKVDDYHLIDRLIRLVLTLPVSTATTERAFSAMKLVKTRKRNKMEDGFLRSCLVLYIEREMAIKITTDSIIDDFNAVKERAVKFKD
ncbi:hypothetical protein EJB05_32035, partial [Eragrostis curvula]